MTNSMMRFLPRPRFVEFRWHRPSRATAWLCLAAIFVQLVPAPVWALGNKPKMTREVRAFSTVLKSSLGKVEMRHEGGEWTPIAQGQVIERGDALRTGDNGTATLQIGDVGIVELSGSTELILRQARQMRTYERKYLIFTRKIVRDDVTIELLRGETKQSFFAVAGRVPNYRIITSEGEIEAPGGSVFSIDLGEPEQEERKSSAETPSLSAIAPSVREPGFSLGPAVSPLFSSFRLAGLITTGILVGAVTPTKLAVSAMNPASPNAKQNFSVTVTAQDAAGNTVTSYDGWVALGVWQGRTKKALAGKNVNNGVVWTQAKNGVASFSGINVPNAGNGYILGAAAKPGATWITGWGKWFNVAAAPQPTKIEAYGLKGAQCGGAQAFFFIVKFLDANGKGVEIPAGSPRDVTVSLVSGPTGGTMKTTTFKAKTGSDGSVSNFPNLKGFEKPGSYKLRLSSPGLPPAEVTLQVMPGKAAKLVMLTEPGGAEPGKVFKTQPRVKAVDAFGNTTGRGISMIKAEIASGSGKLTQRGRRRLRPVWASDGVATFENLAIDKAGTYRLKFTDENNAKLTVTSEPFTVAEPPKPAKLAISAPNPATPKSGKDFSVTVTVQGDKGQTITDYSGDVSLWLRLGRRVMAITGPNLKNNAVTVKAKNGVATFTGIKTSASGNGFFCGAVTTPPGAKMIKSFGPRFNIEAKPKPAKIEAHALKGRIYTGKAPADLFVVKFLDKNGKGVEVPASSPRDLTVSLAGGPEGGTFQTVTFKANAGSRGEIQNFPDLKGFNKPGTYKLRLSSPGLAPAEVSIKVRAGAAAKLLVLSQPDGAEAGKPFKTQPKVQVVDAFGNPTGHWGEIAVEIASGAGTLSDGRGKPRAVSTDNAIAAFKDLRIDKPGTFTLKFRDTNNSKLTVTSDPFTVKAPLVAKKLALVKKADATKAGESFSPAPVIEIQTDKGEKVTNSRAEVTVSVSKGDGTLKGTTKVTAAKGSATFDDIRIEKAGTYTLKFTSPGLTPSEQSGVVVSPAGATNIVFLQQPEGGDAGKPLKKGPKLALQDQYGNFVTEDKMNGVELTAAIASGDGELSGTTKAKFVNGVADFSNLIISKEGTFKLKFPIGALGDVVSEEFTVNAKKISGNDIRNMTPEQFAKIPPKAFEKFTTREHYRVITPEQFKAMTPEQFDVMKKSLNMGMALKPNQIGAFGPNLIKRLQPTQIRRFSNEQLKALSKEAIAALTDEQKKALSEDQKKLLGLVKPVDPNAKITAEQMKKITPLALNKMSPDRFKNIAPDAFATLTMGQIRAITPENFKVMTDEQFRNLVKNPQFFRVMRYMKTNQIAAIQPNHVKMLTTKLLKRMTTKQLKAFTPQQVAALTPAQRRALGSKLNFMAKPAAPKVAKATKLEVTAQPTTATAGKVFEPAFKVVIQSADGKTVSSAANQVSATVASGPGALLGTTKVAAKDGVATFGDLKIENAGKYKIKFTAKGLTEAVSAEFEVKGGDPFKAVIVGGNNQGAMLLDESSPPAPLRVARDHERSRERLIYASRNTHSSPISVSSCALCGENSSDRSVVTVGPSVALLSAHLATSLIIQTLITQTGGVTVEYQDAFGNKSSYSGSGTVTINGKTFNVTITNGRVTIPLSELSAKGVSAPYRLGAATAAGKSMKVEQSSASASTEKKSGSRRSDDLNFTYLYQGKQRTAREARNNEELRQALCSIPEVNDAWPFTCGRVCEDDPDYQFVLNSGKEVGCAWITQNAGKTAIRREKYADYSSGGITVREACPVSMNYCFSEVKVAKASATKLIVSSTSPTDAKAGEKFATAEKPLKVELRDKDGNVVTTATGKVKVEKISGDGTLTGDLEATAEKGVANFKNLSIDKAGTYKLKFTSGDLTPAEATITVTKASGTIQHKPEANPYAPWDFGLFIEPASPKAGDKVRFRIKGRASFTEDFKELAGLGGTTPDKIVKVTVSDSSGRVIATITDGTLSSDNFLTSAWTVPKDIADGLYTVKGYLITRPSMADKTFRIGPKPTNTLRVTVLRGPLTFVDKNGKKRTLKDGETYPADSKKNKNGNDDAQKKLEKFAKKAQNQNGGNKKKPSLAAGGGWSLGTPESALNGKLTIKSRPSSVPPGGTMDILLSGDTSTIGLLTQLLPYTDNYNRLVLAREHKLDLSGKKLVLVNSRSSDREILVTARLPQDVTPDQGDYYVTVVMVDLLGYTAPFKIKGTPAAAQMRREALRKKVDLVLKGLFESYENESPSGFMQYISSSFSGTADNLIALSYSTLQPSIEQDFRNFYDIDFDWTVNAVREYGSKVEVELTWFERYKDETGSNAGKETKRLSQTSTFDFDNTGGVLKLSTWNGAAPFGLAPPGGIFTKQAGAETTTVTTSGSGGGGGGSGCPTGELCITADTTIVSNLSIGTAGTYTKVTVSAGVVVTMSAGTKIDLQSGGTLDIGSGAKLQGTGGAGSWTGLVIQGGTLTQQGTLTIDGATNAIELTAGASPTVTQSGALTLTNFSTRGIKAGASGSLTLSSVNASGAGIIVESTGAALTLTSPTIATTGTTAGTFSGGSAVTISNGTITGGLAFTSTGASSISNTTLTGGTNNITQSAGSLTLSSCTLSGATGTPLSITGGTAATLTSTNVTSTTATSASFGGAGTLTVTGGTFTGSVIFNTYSGTGNFSPTGVTGGGNIIDLQNMTGTLTMTGTTLTSSGAATRGVAFTSGSGTMNLSGITTAGNITTEIENGAASTGTINISGTNNLNATSTTGILSDAGTISQTSGSIAIASATTGISVTGGSASFSGVSFSAIGTTPLAVTGGTASVSNSTISGGTNNVTQTAGTLTLTTCTLTGATGTPLSVTGATATTLTTPTVTSTTTTSASFGGAGTLTVTNGTFTGSVVFSSYSGSGNFSPTSVTGGGNIVDLQNFTGTLTMTGTALTAFGATDGGLVFTSGSGTVNASGISTTGSINNTGSSAAIIMAAGVSGTVNLSGANAFGTTLSNGIIVDGGTVQSAAGSTALAGVTGDGIKITSGTVNLFGVSMMAAGANSYLTATGGNTTLNTAGFTGAVTSGIVQSGAASVTLTNSSVDGSSGAVVAVTGSGNTTLTNTVLTGGGAGADGLTFGSSGALSISGGGVGANQNDGVVISSGSATISNGATISLNANGVNVTGAVTVNLTNANLTTNFGLGVTGIPGATINLDGCYIADNNGEFGPTLDTSVPTDLGGFNPQYDNVDSVTNPSAIPN